MANQRDALVVGPDPDAIAVTTPDRQLTWGELEARARRLANALDRLDLGGGGTWAVLSHNRVEWPEIVMGNARAGSRYVPLNWHLTAAELAELLVDSGAALLVTDPTLATVGRAAAERAGVSLVIELGPDYEAWLLDAGDAAPTERAVGSALMYTGGTTGRSKGVNRSDMAGDASDWHRLLGGWARSVRMPERGVTLSTTPLYHALGSAAMGGSLSLGVPVVIEPRFSPESTLAAIARHRITSAAMVPTQFVRLLKLDADVRAGYDVSTLQWILHTAAPCPAWAKRAMIDWIGPVVYEMYGASEGAGPTICDSAEWLARPGTVGRASARVEYSIVDDDGNDLPAGEIGTIYCRRADGAPEYHGDPDKTASIRLADGRFTVGDVGWLDDDGYLFLADRRVDLVIRGGTNIYPAEIEAVLVEHPAVADAAVFGIPDPEWGQQVKAVLEAMPGSPIDPDDVRRFVASRIAAFKVPASFDIVDALPREAHGKLKKRLLRDRYPT